MMTLYPVDRPHKHLVERHGAILVLHYYLCLRQHRVTLRRLRVWGPRCGSPCRPRQSRITVRGWGLTSHSLLPALRSAQHVVLIRPRDLMILGLRSGNQSIHCHLSSERVPEESKQKGQQVQKFDLPLSVENVKRGPPS